MLVLIFRRGGILPLEKVHTHVIYAGAPVLSPQTDRSTPSADHPLQSDMEAVSPCAPQSLPGFFPHPYSLYPKGTCIFSIPDMPSQNW